MPEFLLTAGGIVISLLAILLLGTLLALLLTRTPYIPTPHHITSIMVDFAKLQGNERVYDLGCGDGRLLFETKRRFPGMTAVGYEVSPYPYLKALARNTATRRGVRLLFRSFLESNLSDADVIFVYLLPPMMEKLQRKLARELRPGTRVISHGFEFKGRTPVEILDFKKLPLSFGYYAHPERTPMLYRYLW